MSEESANDDVFVVENVVPDLVEYEQSPQVRRRPCSSGASSSYPSTSDDKCAEDNTESVFEAVHKKSSCDTPTEELENMFVSDTRKCRNKDEACSPVASPLSSPCKDKPSLRELVSEETSVLLEKLFEIINCDDLDGLEDFVALHEEEMSELSQISNHQGMTPVTLASSLGHLDILHIINEHAGEWINLFDDAGLCAIHYAITNCHEETVDYLVGLGQHSCISHSGRTPLHFAAECGNQRIITSVLKNVEDVNEATKSGKTALHLASTRGLSETVEILLTSGADVNAEDKDGYTSLCFAASKGHCDVIQTLVDAGASVNYFTVDGLNPLFMALLERHTEASILLIDLGANMSLTDTAGLNALHRACVFDETNVVKHILNVNDSVDIDSQTKLGMTALAMAVKFHNLEVASLLTEAGADVNLAENHDGFFPLYHAVDSNKREMIELLLSCNVNVNAQTETGNTALYHAAKRGYVEIVKLLIENGSDVQLAKRNGWTPLHIAVRYKECSVVEYLLESGADANAADHQGQTPLAIAAYLQLPDILRVLSPKCKDPVAVYKVALLCNSNILLYLRVSGIDLMQKNAFGWTPLHFCCHNGKSMATETLLKVIPREFINITDADGYTPLHFAVLNNHYNIARRLVHGQASLNTVTSKGHTAISTAVLKDNHKMVDLLFRHGADINMENANGETPIFHAVEIGSITLVDYLIRGGAHMSHRAKNDMTPAMVAAKLSKTDILKRLLASGAQVAKVDSLKNSLLHIAAQHGSVDTVLELVLDKLVDLHAENILGKTALQVAAYEGHACVVEVLLDAGAKLEMLDENGCVKYDFAKHSAIWETFRTWCNPGATLRRPTSAGSSSHRPRSQPSAPRDLSPNHSSASSSSHGSQMRNSNSSSSSSNLLANPWERTNRRSSDSQVTGSSRLSLGHESSHARSSSSSPTPPRYRETAQAMDRRRRNLAAAKSAFLQL